METAVWLGVGMAERRCTAVCQSWDDETNKRKNLSLFNRRINDSSGFNLEGQSVEEQTKANGSREITVAEIEPNDGSTQSRPAFPSPLLRFLYSVIDVSIDAAIYPNLHVYLQLIILFLKSYQSEIA